MKLDDLNDQLGLDLESEDYDSIGGFIIGLLDHLPEEGRKSPIKLSALWWIRWTGTGSIRSIFTFRRKKRNQNPLNNCKEN